MSEQRISEAELAGMKPENRLEEALRLDLLDARQQRDELRIENAQLCEKLAAAQRGEDITGLVKRIAKAERELALARPVVEAARNQWIETGKCAVGEDGDWYAATEVTENAVCAYDAAREKGDGK
jgi:hypothetical protein